MWTPEDPGSPDPLDDDSDGEEYVPPSVSSTESPTPSSEPAGDVSDSEDSRASSDVAGAVGPRSPSPSLQNQPSTSRSSPTSSSRTRSSSAQCEPPPRTRKTSAQGEPPPKLRKISEDEPDGENCPICLEAWTNSGDHRLVSLKCGHLFGSSCLDRWLRTRPAKDRNCPTCKTKAAVKDVRHIYARRIVAADNSQLAMLQKQVEELQAEKNRVELELQKTQISHRACVMQLEVLRSTLTRTQAPRESARRFWRYALEKNMQICQDNGCRVLTYNCRTYEFYISQKSTNNLFPGYGIRKINCLDYKLGQFVHLHPKAIRDMTYSQPRDLLLSVGLDSSARIVERGIPSTVVPAEVPLWSCSWDYLRSNEFYVGGVGGVIQQYDVRTGARCLRRLNAPSDLSPVVSLHSTAYGLLACQLNSCWLWTPKQQDLMQWEPRALPVDGPFMSLTYDTDSSRALVSCRPCVSGDRARLAVCKLRQQAQSNEVVVEVEQSFPGSTRCTLMSRPAVVTAPGARWVATHSESEATLYLHGLDGARTLSLPASEPAVDVCGVDVNGESILAALSQQRLRLYKAVATNT